VHHNAYQFGDILFTGDVAGVKIGLGPVVPPCPPPDIHVELWIESIQKMKNLKPSTLYLTHFGKIESVEEHLSELESILMDWANWMKPYFEAEISPEEITPKFMLYTKEQLIRADVSVEDLVKY